MSALLRLLQLTDPALPIGGYAHSAGLETYVQAGIVCGPASAEDFVRSMLRTGIHFTDAALMALAHRAVQEGDWDEVMRLHRLCEAVKMPREIREASRKLGGRLMKIFGEELRTTSCELRGERGSELQATSCKLQGGKEGKVKGEDGEEKLLGGVRHYAVVFGYCAAMLGVGLREALTGYYYNAAAGMVTNCVKLIPMGQQDGQALLFRLHPLIMELVEKSLEPCREMIGICCTGLDIACMQHERLYSRLYMS